MAGNPAPQGAEMNQLRQEAIRRAKEMQARARIPRNAPPEPPEAPPPMPAPAPQPRQRPRPEPERCPPAPLPRERCEAGTLDFLTKDPERTLILLLLLILMEERSDNSLLFALMYLLM